MARTKAQAKTDKGPPRRRFYVVTNGREFGFFDNYDTLRIHTDRFSNAVHRSFTSLDEAVDFLRDHSKGPWLDHRTDETDRAELAALLRRRKFEQRSRGCAPGALDYQPPPDRTVPRLHDSPCGDNGVPLRDEHGNEYNYDPL
jgi:hypothetical protein